MPKVEVAAPAAPRGSETTPESTPEAEDRKASLSESRGQRLSSSLRVGLVEDGRHNRDAHRTDAQRLAAVGYIQASDGNNRQRRAAAHQRQSLQPCVRARHARACRPGLLRMQDAKQTGTHQAGRAPKHMRKRIAIETRRKAKLTLALLPIGNMRKDD